MAIALNDNLSINAPKLVDDRTKKSDGSAYASKADVLANLVASRRAVGLMVLINEELHYFKTGTLLESDLFKLSSGEMPHNELSGLQGGKSNEPKEYFHLSESQHERVLDLIYINSVSTISLSPTSGERGALQALTVSYNIQTKDDVFTDASINQGIGSVFANINTGTKTISGGTATQNKTFILTLNYARNGVATNETKTATYNAYAPQFAGVASVDDITTYNEMIFYLIKYVQSSFAISKKSSPKAEYIWFVSNKGNAIIKDQNNFVQNQGVWDNGSTEFYRKEIDILLADGVTSQTVYLYRSRGVKTLTDFTYKIE